MTKADEYLGKRYRNDGGSYWKVVGYIDKPAVVMRDPLTGQAQAVVINSGQFSDMVEMPNEEALCIAENLLIEKSS